MRTESFPLAIDAWVDLILASTSHRSSNVGQQKFGEGLLRRYFEQLPERFKDDPTATKYFDEMILAAAAAIRGFSVVRDIFQTRMNSLERTRTAEIEHLKMLETLSPLNKEGVWGRGLATVGAIGLAGPLQSVIKSKIVGVPEAWIFAIALAICSSILILVIVLHLLRISQVKRIERAFPENVMQTWQDQAQSEYRQLIGQFVRAAAIISRKFYPQCEMDESDDAGVQALLERHFTIGRDASWRVQPTLL